MKEYYHPQLLRPARDYARLRAIKRRKALLALAHHALEIAGIAIVFAILLLTYILLAA